MHHLLLISWLLIFSPFILAKGTTAQLDTQYVIANQVTPAELNIVEFQHEDFSGKYQSLSDFLQFHGGIQTRGSGIGNNVSLSIRGSNHLQIRLFIDGHEINEAQYGGFDINKLPLQQINSIKIIKDNATGIGGVIMLETLSPSDNLKSNIFTSISSFETYEQSFTQYFSGVGSSAFNWNTLRSEANYEYPVDAPFDNPSDNGRIEKLKNNQFQKDSLLYNWKYDSSNKKSLGVKFQLSESQKNLPNYQQNRADNSAFLKDSELSGQAFLKAKINNYASNNLSIYLSNKDETYSDPDGLIGVGTYINKYKSKVNTVKNTSTVDLNNLTFNFDYTLKEESFQSDHTLVLDSVKCLSELSTCDIKSEQLSHNIELQGNWESPNKIHGIAISNSYLYLDKQQVKLFSSPDKLSSTESYTGWSSAYTYHGFDSSTIRLGLSKSLRTPTLYELFGNRGLMKSNVNLKPEISNNINFNISNAINLTLLENNLYYRQLSDAIVAQFSGGTGSYKNLSNVDILGLETKISTHLSHFNLSLSSTIQDSTVRSQINGFNNKKLAGVFHSSFSAAATYQHTEKFALTYQYQHDDELYVDTANLEKHDGRIIHNMRFHYNANALRASFSIENILDSRFKNQQNRPAPGLFFHSSIQYAF